MGVGLDTSEPFGVWLRGQRQHRLGLTQTELAQRVFCSSTTIRKIELGSRRPARGLAERLLIVLGIPAGDLAAHIAWARGLPYGDVASDERESALARGIKLNSPANGAQFVLVPLDAIASFGTEPPAVVQLQEPFMGRSQWVPVPLAAVAIFGMTPPCLGDACSGLRYSQACQTNWVRITRLCREGRVMQACLRDEVGNAISATTVEVDAAAVYGYGSMWFAPTGKIAVQACGLIDGYHEECTSLH
jgi:transcriptional regulator with XRE-family HTH domain